MKTCTEWSKIEYIEAICPHCHVIDTFFMIGDVGDIAQCVHCKKQFKLGEPE